MFKHGFKRIRTLRIMAMYMTVDALCFHTITSHRAILLLLVCHAARSRIMFLSQSLSILLKLFRDFWLSNAPPPTPLPIVFMSSHFLYIKLLKLQLSASCKLDWPYQPDFACQLQNILYPILMRTFQLEFISILQMLWNVLELPGSIINLTTEKILFF